MDNINFMSELIESICQLAVESSAEDIFLKSDSSPRIRLDGSIREIEQTVTMEDMEIFYAMCGVDYSKDGESDLSWRDPKGNRFRVNCYKSMGSLCAVMRPLKENNKTLAQLGLPEGKLQSWLTMRSGLVLITGATGSGKSTTLSSGLKWVADNLQKHIITVEDPIEYLLSSSQSLVSQRQVGIDTDSFSSGLKSSLRQSPDVIFVGEIRDYETAMTALHACETGHLVVSTLHSSTVPETIERLVSIFPAANRKSCLNILSKQLVGILCQKLVARKEGGLCLLSEHMGFSGAIKKWVLEGELNKISEFHQTGQSKENLRFIDSIMHYYKLGVIEEDVARAACEDREEFDRFMMGVDSGSR